jgi:hypothetical protein
MKRMMIAGVALLVAGAFAVPPSWGQASSTAPMSQPGATTKSKSKSPCAQYKRGTQERKDCVAAQKAEKKNNQAPKKPSTSG